VAWDGGANKWQMQEFMQTQLQFTAGNVDADGFVLAPRIFFRTPRIAVGVDSRWGYARPVTGHCR
jgi:hypothetical protein